MTLQTILSTRAEYSSLRWSIQPDVELANHASAPSLQPVRCLRIRHLAQKTVVIDPDPRPPVDLSMIVASPTDSQPKKDAVTEFADPVHVTKKDIIDQELYKSLCNDCDVEECASPLVLACHRYKRLPQLLAILDCALSYCHIERLTFQEQCIVLYHVAKHCGNQSLLFGEDLRGVCGFAQSLILEYNLTQMTRIMWALAEMLGDDEHVAHLLQAVSRKYRSKVVYLSGEHLSLLAKSLRHCRQKTALTKVMHPMLYRAMMQKLDAASANEVIDTFQVLHEISPLPAIDSQYIDPFLRNLRRDLKVVQSENIAQAALLFRKLQFAPSGGDAMVSDLVDEFLCRVPLMDDSMFVTTFASLVTGCDFLHRQVQACVPRLFRVMFAGDLSHLIVLASAMSHSRLRHSPYLSLVRDELGLKLLMNLQAFSASQCVLLLHNILHMRWKELMLPHLLAQRAFDGYRRLSIDEICCLVHDYSFVQQPDGLTESFCKFVANFDMRQHVLSWHSGNRLIIGVLMLRFNHRPWLEAIETFLINNFNQFLMPENLTELVTLVNALYKLNYVQKILLKRLMGRQHTNSPSQLSPLAQARVLLSAAAVDQKLGKWNADVSRLTLDTVQKLKAPVRAELFDACLVGGESFSVSEDVLNWLRQDQLDSLPQDALFEDVLSSEFVATRVNLLGCYSPYALLLADHSNCLVPWSQYSPRREVYDSATVTASDLADISSVLSLQPVAVLTVSSKAYLVGNLQLHGSWKTRLRLLKSLGFKTLVLNMDALPPAGPERVQYMKQFLADNGLPATCFD